MKNFLSLLFIGCLAPALYAAEPGPAPINENAFLVQKEIASWPTDQTFNTQVAVYNCQAVRLHPDWFLTSAHCVYSACATRPCTVEITLAQSADLTARVRVKHSTTSPAVFIYGGFFPGQNRISGVDAALIRFNAQKAEYSYTRTEDGQPLTRTEFEKLLRFDPEAQLQLNASGARLLNVSGVSTVRLRPGIVVPKVTNGNISYLAGGGDVYFVDELQHFLSPGFGVRRGNSGGGVFTRSGDLAGVVSSLLYAKDGSASFQDGEGNTVLTLKNAHDYFMFTGFNGATMNFIRNKVPHLRTVSVLPEFAVPSKKKFTAVVEAANAASMQF